MPDSSNIEGRKLDHIRVVLGEDVNAKGIAPGFAAYHLPHTALPDIDLADVDTTTTFLGKSLRVPILISSMTGGAQSTERINRALAEAAEHLGMAMGVGSQRAAVADPQLANTYQVRRVAPRIPLLANLGAVQLNYGFGVEQCKRAVDMIEADALILHFNPLQEAVQPEGNVNFKGLLSRIEEVCRALPVPVIAKEVGNGISGADALRLYEVGVQVIDVAGAGGTSWSEVERFRHKTDHGARVAGAFAGWGIPTTRSDSQVRQVLPTIPLIASGGVRSGVDIAKAIVLGATLAGTARPALAPAIDERGSAAVVEVLQTYIDELRVAMFCTGSADLQALRMLQLHRW
ncbi:MAG: type 2 isopentenyl-diphosphate Delta-isomerase [Chloroflexaceae bacterium]|nr:type 2 isopentenyl-diphosphate Delta-isomerase [Chloroflexaceae bacterium]